jgi:thiamine-phosphate pyrophosphorylase
MRSSQSSLYRIIDVNSNRASEGLRVVEDICRLSLESAPLTRKFKTLRHEITSIFQKIENSGIKPWRARDSEHDIGADRTSQTSGKKVSLEDLIRANCRRGEEALRAMEESFQALSLPVAAAQCATSRFTLYTLEAQALSLCPRSRWKDVHFYVITDSAIAAPRSVLEVVKKTIAGGAQAIQFRDPNMPWKEKIKLGRELRKITRDAGIPLIINDRPDLALLLEADGLHLGQNDFPVEEARKLTGQDIIIGKSTHNLKQALQALKEPIDYLSVGPIYQTTSKPDAWNPVGLSLLSKVRVKSKIPITAIGGITIANLENVVKSGTDTIAVISAVMAADDIKKVTQKFIKAIERILKERGRQ